MRLVDADTLIQKKRKGTIGNISGDFVAGFDIDTSPTIDAVPVVRCQECKHKNTTVCPAYDAPFMRTSLRIKFCSEGQRREADHEVSGP